MRIFSKYKDYYDSIQSLGYDPNVIYKREMKEEYGEFFSTNVISRSTNSPYNTINFEFFIIGFCGELYVCMEIIEKTPTNEKIHFCYSIEDVDKVIENIGNKDITKRYYYGKRKMYKSSDIFYRKTLIDYIFSKEYLKNSHSDGHKYVFGNRNEVKTYYNAKNIFLDKKVPIFIIESIRNRKQKLTLNPVLKDFNFQKVKDPYTAYQEIAQYISGFLGIDTPETIDISDEDQLYKKGFDEWSFKTPPKNKK